MINLGMELPTSMEASRKLSVAVSPKIVYLPFNSIENNSLKASVKIISQSNDKLRIHCEVANPDSDLSVRRLYEKVLYPGGNEELEINFIPKSWARYTNKIVIKTHRGETVSVAVFAYPVIEDFEIPPNINLGSVIISQGKKMVIPLHSKVPVDFDFRISVIEKHPSTSWHIHPQKGCLKGNSVQELVIEFCPTHLQTCQLKFELCLTQFNFEPRICRIFGTGVLPDQKKLFQDGLDKLGIVSKAPTKGAHSLQLAAKLSPKLAKYELPPLQNVRAQSLAKSSKTFESSSLESQVEAPNTFNGIHHEPLVGKLEPGDLEKPSFASAELPPPVWHNSYPLQDRFVRVVWSLIVYRRIKTRVQILKRALLTVESQRADLVAQDAAAHTISNLFQTGDSNSEAQKASSEASESAALCLNDASQKRKFYSWEEFLTELSKQYPQEMEGLKSESPLPPCSEATNFALPPLFPLEPIKDGAKSISSIWRCAPRLNFMYGLDASAENLNFARKEDGQRHLRPFSSAGFSAQKTTAKSAEPTVESATQVRASVSQEFWEQPFLQEEKSASGKGLCSINMQSMAADNDFETEETALYIINGIGEQTFGKDLSKSVVLQTENLANSLNFFSTYWKVFST